MVSFIGKVGIQRIIYRSTLQFLLSPPMKILHYADLDTTGLSRKIKAVEQALERGDFASADVKKLRPGNLYRAKLDREARLLFQFAHYRGETYALLLEVLPNHEYDKSKFLRGAEVREENFRLPDPKRDAEEEQPAELRYVNPKVPRFHLLDKVISLDDDQEEIYQLPVPLIIIGSAGSGKTALTLEKMKQFPGNVAYVSLSNYLVENSRRIYYANGYENPKQEVDFLSFEDFLGGIRIPIGRPLDYRTFERWYERYRQTFKFKDPYKLFEEFKGVLTGSVTDAPYLTRERYRSLGVKQSIFLDAERERVYDLFEKYRDFLAENDYYDANIVSYEYLGRVEPRYDFIVVDEVQDLTNVQLLLVLRSLNAPENFILSGDSNQIVHPNFFSWSKIKTLFFKRDLHGSALRILKTNYRNSKRVTKLSNDLLKIKNARFGSIDRESTYLINTVAEEEGGVFFYEDDAKIKQELNRRTENSAKYAVLVMDRDQKARVSQYFKTPLVFTIQEAKGLEYENIILINFVSDYQREFRVITRGVGPDDLRDENLRFSRAKDKTDKEQEAYKFYVNSLYVAFTRAVQNLHIVEATRKHDLLELLGVVETTKKVEIKQERSSEEEWLAEARRLELQGKTEQAEAIRARLRGEDFVSSEAAERLIEQLFGPDAPAPDAKGKRDYDKKAAERLFRFARARHRYDLMRRLRDELGYGPAKQYLGEYEKAQKLLLSTVRNGNQRVLERLFKKFGPDLREHTLDMSALMLAAQYGKTAMLDWLLTREASVTATDRLGRTAVMHLLVAHDKRQLKPHLLRGYYDRLAPAGAKRIYDNRLYVINRNSMEFFLLNLLTALRYEVFTADDPPSRQCLLMDDFMQVIEEMPSGMLADYRRKRQYVNSILSKSERDRDDRYNRKLFIRRSRGCYDLLPGGAVVWEG